MPQAALHLSGAELEQMSAHAGEPQDDTLALAREATRLAEIAASFALFGLQIAQEDDGATPPSADLAYRVADIRSDAPANDWVAPTAPQLTRRGLHIDPASPAKLLRALDWVVVIAAAQLAAMWGAGAGLLQLSIGDAAAFIASAAALKGGLWLTDFYRFSLGHIKPERGMGGLALGAIAGLIVANSFAPDAKAAAALAATLPLAAMLLAGVHAAFAIWIAAAHRCGVFAETVVLVGATEAAARLAKRTARSGETRIVALVDDRGSRAPDTLGDAPKLGSVGDLLRWEHLPNIDRIVIAVPHKADERVRQIIERLSAAPNRVDLLIDFDTASVRGQRAERFGGMAVACVSGSAHNRRRAFGKRAQDLVLGGLLTAILALPMAAIALAIRLGGQGPALYRQRRYGFNNRAFEVLKFRTLDAEGRATRLGSLLQRTGLDDLPLLINVLRGEMSLVGPRPHAMDLKASDRAYADIVARYAHRHQVKPGILGWAQVNGQCGPVTSAACVRRRVRLDLDYVARASLWLDLEIVVRSIPLILASFRAKS
jgi:lipopolysaccharide/colanic/teichoic acid biosynthesis glycosyltransferase